MTVPVVRQRAKAPKVRTGCKTCRARHLKCDEEKPNCARCRKSGRCCAGYDPPRGEVQVRSLAFVRPKSTSPSTLLSVTIPSPSGSIMEMDSAQRRAFDFFRLHTIHQLPGNASLLSWERLALRAGVNDPAVLHAVIALGSLHKSSSSDFQNLELQDFALDQCNKAMTLAREQIAAIGPESPDTSVEVVMLLSLLLWCFEIWCGQDGRANLHFQLGLQILYERVKHRHCVKSPGSKRTVKLQLNPQDDMDVLLQTFVRLDLDMCIPGRNAPYLLPVVSEELPSFFLSLENALVYLDGLTASLNEVTHRLHDRALAELRDEGTGCLDRKHVEFLAAVRLRSVDLTSDPILAAAYQENKDSVRDWMKAFTSVEMTADNESAHMLAQIQAFGLWFEVSCLRHSDEMACDRWQEQFDYILSVAERYVRCQGHTSNSESPNSPGKRNPDGTRPGFTLGTALVNVVVIIAWKCRNSATRRRTMRLLRKINLAGVFDGDWLCALTSHVIEMEETSAAQLNPDFSIAEYQNHEIPLEARILDIDFLDWAMPEFYKHEVGKVVYAYQDQNGIIQVDMTSFRVRRTDTTSSLESSCSSSDTSPVDLKALDMGGLEYPDSALLDDLSTWPVTRTYCSDVVLDAT